MRFLRRVAGHGQQELGAGEASADASSPTVPRAHSGGNPIRSREADHLGRSKFADHLAAALLEEAADEGVVAALVGPWGQGKTSI